jgi:enoyl-[acyl-carrier protein] reductase I
MTSAAGGLVPGLMQGKRGLIMGLANDKSLAWGIARKLHEHGAEMAFSYPGEALAKRVGPLAEQVGSDFLIQCDVGDMEAMDRAFAEIEARWGRLDFLVHAIGFSDKNELRGKYVDTSLENFLLTMNISAYSLVAATKRARPLMKDGGSILTLTYYGAEKVVPHYNVMGVAKAALETSVKYLANDLGPENIRVNARLVGPDAARVVHLLVRTFGQGDGAEHIVVHQHDQHVAFFQRRIDIDLHRAGAFEFPRQFGGIGLDHVDPVAEATGQRCRHEPRRAFAEVVDIGLEGEAEAGDFAAGCASTSAEARAITWWILPSFTPRAVRISGVCSGAPATMNHGSTAMQCPPTPGPGCRMLTRGWRLASRITSHTSSPSGRRPSTVRWQRRCSRRGRRSRPAWSSRPASVGGHAGAAHEALVEGQRLARTARGDAADRAVVVGQFLQDAAGQHALRAIGDRDIWRPAVRPGIAGPAAAAPSGRASVRWCRPARSIQGSPIARLQHSRRRPAARQHIGDVGRVVTVLGEGRRHGDHEDIGRRHFESRQSAARARPRPAPARPDRLPRYGSRRG